MHACILQRFENKKASMKPILAFPKRVLSRNVLLKSVFHIRKRLFFSFSNYCTNCSDSTKFSKCSKLSTQLFLGYLMKMNKYFRLYCWNHQWKYALVLWPTFIKPVYQDPSKISSQHEYSEKNQNLNTTASSDLKEIAIICKSWYVCLVKKN